MDDRDSIHKWNQMKTLHVNHFNNHAITHLCVNFMPDTYSVLECVFLSMWLVAVVPLWGSLGEDGREESVISSMSEWDEADFGDFFLLKACLKELRNCRDKTHREEAVSL